MQFVQPPDTIIHGDTVVLHVQILNRAGDTIPGLPILLASVDTLLTIDSARVAVIGRDSGTVGHVVARTTSGPPSDPLPIVVK